jgi:hypothetical protein
MMSLFHGYGAAKAETPPSVVCLLRLSSRSGMLLAVLNGNSLSQNVSLVINTNACQINRDGNLRDFGIREDCISIVSFRFDQRRRGDGFAGSNRCVWFDGRNEN